MARPPAGAVAKRPNRQLGEVARWRHADKLPYVEVTLVEARPEERHGRRLVRKGRPPTVRIAGALEDISDPDELATVARMVAEATEWLRVQTAEPEPPAFADQRSFDDELALL